MTDRQKALTNLEKLREAGVNDTKIVDYLISNWMTGSDAAEATNDLLIDEGIEDADDTEDDE